MNDDWTRPTTLERPKRGYWLTKLSPTLLQSYGNDEMGRKIDQIYEYDTASLAKTSLVLIYASASWCPPCAQFTPKLNYIYNAMKAYDHNGIEIIFMSHDETENSFENYFKKMNWLSFPYHTTQQLKENDLPGKVGVKHLPSLFVYDNKRGVFLKEVKNEVDELFNEVKSLKSREMIQSKIAIFFNNLVSRSQQPPPPPPQQPPSYDPNPFSGNKLDEVFSTTTIDTNSSDFYHQRQMDSSFSKRLI